MYFVILVRRHMQTNPKNPSVIVLKIFLHFVEIGSEGFTHNSVTNMTNGGTPRAKTNKIFVGTVLG